MSSNKVPLFWYKIATRTRNAIETGGANIQNKFYLNREWSVAILRYKLSVAEAKVKTLIAYVVLYL